MIYTVQANMADELNYCKTEPKLVIRRELKPEYLYFKCRTLTLQPYPPATVSLIKPVNI